MDLVDASKKAHKIASARKQSDNTYDALKHCAGEVIEATKAYNDWFNTLDCCQQVHEDFKKMFADEIADVVMCCLSICGTEGINIEKALERVFEKNERRTQENP